MTDKPKHQGIDIGGIDQTGVSIIKPKHLRLEILRIDGWQTQWKAEHSDWESEQCRVNRDVIFIHSNCIELRRINDSDRTTNTFIPRYLSEDVTSFIHTLNDIRLAIHEYNIAHGTEGEGSVKDIFVYNIVNSGMMQRPCYDKIGTVEIIE